MTMDHVYYTPRYPLRVAENNPNHPGQIAGQPLKLGSFGRFRIYPVHTRFDYIEWVVTDAEEIDPVTNRPGVIIQERTYEAAVGKAANVDKDLRALLCAVS